MKVVLLILAHLQVARLVTSGCCVASGETRCSLIRELLCLRLDSVHLASLQNELVGVTFCGLHVHRCKVIREGCAQMQAQPSTDVCMTYQWSKHHDACNVTWQAL